MEAKYLPTWARKACKAIGMTARTYEIVNYGCDVDALPEDKVIIVVKNSRRTVELTVGDMHYAERYL